MNLKTLSLALIIISLSGCANLSSKTSFKENKITSAHKVKMNQNLILKSNGNRFIGELTTDDNWETATFTTAKKEQFHLTRAISGSGIKLNNGSLIIHFKGDSGILERNSIVTNFKIQ